ncbi:hypothetical protein BDR26DRAFT_918549 [Obelidium mucronatum]|nr:hypothetical protein BDR26DRAFT_918549 [Obelidium mucronatum]
MPDLDKHPSPIAAASSGLQNKPDMFSTRVTMTGYAILQFLPLVLSTVGIACLYKVDDSHNNISKASPSLLVNGSGASMVATSFWRWMDDFPAYQQSFETSRVQMSFLSVGSGIGRSDFFAGYSLFGATDSDISKGQLSYFLPDGSDASQLNVTKFINPQTPQHLGTLLFPSISGALAIVYNIQGVNGTLIFNATVLGNIFCGAITLWNDPSIQQLNPAIALPNSLISVVGRADSSGSTNIFTTYLSTYSPAFKKAIGISSQPIWPASFVKRNSAIELMYVCETLQNSITYVPLEAVIQANSATVVVAGIINRNGRVVYPSVGAVAEALSISTPPTYQRHQYFSITDANSENAYPISLMSFVLLREHYFYFSPGSNTDCDRVKEMVLFWYFAFTHPTATAGLAGNGWVPISGKLLDFNMKALSSITCNHVNMMELIRIELDKTLFYGSDKEKYALDSAYSFWDIADSSFAASAVGSAVYIFFYAIVLLSGLIPYGINMMTYQRSKMKEDEEDRKAKLESEELDIDETAVGNEAEKGGDHTQPPIHKVKHTNQNYLGVLTIFITMFQLVYLSIHRSIVIDTSSLIVTLISYFGLIIDSPKYYAILIAMAIVWVGCLQYSIIIHPFLAKNYPFKVAHLTTFHTFIATYLPNYVAIFYNPSVELFAKALDCRLSPTTNIYFSSFDPLHLTCFTGPHWIMVVLSCVYTPSFIFAVVRYSKILKSLRKNFDLKDKAWKIYFGSIVKCIVIVFYFNVSSKLFLAIAAVLEFGLGLAVLSWKPNDFAWYDRLRGGSYIFCSMISLLLFILELSVNETQYSLRSSIRDPLLFSIFTSLVVFSLAGLFFASRMFETELSAAEKDKQKREIEEFFAAFVQESLDELNEYGQSEGNLATTGENDHVAETVAMNIPEEQAQEHPTPKNSMDRRHSHVSNRLGSSRYGGSKLSLAQTKKLEPIIHKAKLAGLISAPDSITLLKAIRSQDPLVTFLFKRCNGDFMVFKELLRIQVIQMFEERFSSQGFGIDASSKIGHSKMSLGFEQPPQVPPVPSAINRKASTKLKEAVIAEEEEC